MQTEYDYIVIGAGSADCAVAARLADGGNHSVALLEAGPHDHSPLVTVPVGFAATALKAGARNYGLRTEREPHLNHRRGYQPRGRGLGGSSSINGMVYVRGTPGDYDGWAAAGCTGWAWADVLPYFRRSECNEWVAGRDDDPLHGGHGPLHVSDLRSPNPISRRFIEAAIAAGHRRNSDFNGSRQEGAGLYQVTQHRGERWNAARAYLHRGERGSGTLSGGRANLSVLPDTQVRRIRFEGRAAVGASVVHDGKERTLVSRREIVLSGGAFGSPHLLMLSGVGPASHLRNLDIPVVFDAPEVGQNLQEHADVLLSWRLNTANLFGVSLRGGLRMLFELQRYWRQRRGMLTSNIVEAGVFIKSRPELAEPDVQLAFAVALLDRRRFTEHGYSCHVTVLRPFSRGQVRLVSPNADRSPAIELNLLSDPRDMNVLVAGVRATKLIFDQEPMSCLGGKELHHGHLNTDRCDDEAVRKLVRDRADTVFHPVGTCRMGSDEASVVDPQLRVRGVGGLRVADASIMPTLISGNTNAPAMMIGEKAADLILGRPKDASIGDGSFK